MFICKAIRNEFSKRTFSTTFTKLEIHNNLAFLVNFKIAISISNLTVKRGLGYHKVYYKLLQNLLIDGHFIYC